MATLTGNTVASTYKQLLKVTSEGIGADASAKYIEDGLGTDSALSISTTRVGIGTAAPDALLHLKSSVSNGVMLKLENNNDDQFAPRLQFLKDVSADAEADGDFLGQIQFRGQDSGDVITNYAQIVGMVDDVTGGTEDGKLKFEVIKNADQDGSQMFLTATGLGIGTDSPAVPLTVNGGDSATVLDIQGRESDDYGIISFWTNNGATLKGNIQSNADDDMIFRTGPSTNRMTIAAAGDVTVSTGSLIIGTAGKGISFSATNTPAQSAGSGTSNLLDDYEEGTFTASLTSASAPTSVPTATCNYTKIGNVVNVFIRFTNVDTSGGSGDMSITGLPFTSKNIVDASISVPMTHQLSIPNAYVSSIVSGGTTAINFLSPTDNGSWGAVAITAGTGKYLSLSQTYLSA